MKTRQVIWGTLESDNGRLLIEEEGEERRVTILRPDRFEDGWNLSIGFTEPQTEWEWFLDFAGIESCTSLYQTHIISQVLKNNDVECIFELGTATGTGALYLGVCGAVFGIPVYTFDRYSEPVQMAKPGLEKMGVQFFEMDYMEDMDKVLELIDGRRVYLICDGDTDKKKDEFNLYVPHLARGSVVSIHDWIAEAEPSDIRDTVEKYNMRPFGVRDWLRHRVMFATFVKGGQ